MRKYIAIIVSILAIAVLSYVIALPRRQTHRPQIIKYETVVESESTLHSIKGSTYDSDEAIATLETGTPVKIIGIERLDSNDPTAQNFAMIKVMVRADTGKSRQKGWVCLSDLKFDSSILETILKDSINGEPYANYIVNHIGRIDQALAMRLMTRVCERARFENDPERRHHLFSLAIDYLNNVPEFDPSSCEMTPLHLAARYDDIDFAKMVYFWCERAHVPIDCPAGGSANTALIEAAIGGNADVAEFLLSNGADKNCRNAKGKTAMDYISASSSTALRNLVSCSRDIADYESALASLSAEDMRGAPDDACLIVPVSAYVRCKNAGMTATAVDYADYDDLLKELSKREASDENERSKSPAEAFPFDANVNTDDGSSPNLRDSASLQGAVIGSAADASPVTILERRDTPESIDGIDDYWYRVRSGTSEGWCFGGYLSSKIPMTVDALRQTRDYGWQIPLQKDETYYALADCSLRAASGESVSVKQFEQLRIIGDFGKDHASFGDSLISPYYLAVNADQACGIVSGKYLANGRFVTGKSDDLELYVLSKEAGERGDASKMLMRDTSRKTLNELGLITGSPYIIDGTVDGIDASQYAFRNREIVFLEVRCMCPDSDDGHNMMRVFLNIDGDLAYYGASDRYSEYGNHRNDEMFANSWASWDDRDPSIITVVKYGRYRDECDGSPVEYTDTVTYTRNEGDAFDYILTDEKHEDEIPQR